MSTASHQCEALTTRAVRCRRASFTLHVVTYGPFRQVNLCKEHFSRLRKGQLVQFIPSSLDTHEGGADVMQPRQRRRRG